MGITITPIDPTDQAAVDAAYEVRAAADQADVPDFPPLCRRRFEAAIRHPMPGNLPVRALARLDGAPAGFLALDLHAFQQITIVDPEHRGHRLGLLVKVENLRYALDHEPGLRAVDTFNAQANAHMIAINEALGFRPVDAWTDWQLTL